VSTVITPSDPATLLAGAVAVSGPSAPPSGQTLAALADWMRHHAQHLQKQRAREETMRTGRSVILADHPGGAALAVRWFAPGQPTPVHDHHGWGVTVVVEGRSRYERWQPVTATTARLAQTRVLETGEAVWWPGPPRDLHR
jgi:predicted metal-dependent enzyme (double-stranded beta helix superfamily)